MAYEPKDIVGKPVIATSSGREIGSVDHLLFEPGKHLLYGLVLKSKEKNDPERLLHRPDVKAIGAEAVTVESEDQVGLLASDADAREYMAMGLRGLKILTEEGNEVGNVDSVHITDDGGIESYHTSTGILGLGSGRDIPREQVIAAGRDAIVVSASVGRDLAGSEQPERSG